ncbi:MAG: pilus assembly protein PilP, partial [Pseudomonadota bacterium]
DIASLRIWTVGEDKCGVYASLFDPNGYAYRVRLGNYVGKNFGMVMEITGDAILLREVFQTESGEWEQRDATIKRKIK